MTERIDQRTIDEIKSRLTVSSVVSRRVQLVKKGREFEGLCPFHNEKTPSFFVNDTKGFAHCFGCDWHGDVISFVMATERLDFIDAAKRLAGDVGVSATQPAGARPKPLDEWQPMVPPPATAAAPDLGRWDHIYTYRDAAGAVLRYVVRRDAVGDAKKQILPLTYGWLRDDKHPQGAVGWHHRHPAALRSLYGLDLLAERPDASVIVCEGEKAVDRARVDFPAWVVVTWSAGGKAAHLTDWSPLKGRHVALWSDRDRHAYPRNHEHAGAEKPWHEQEGFLTMVRVAELLAPLDCRVVEVDVEGLVPDGADAADLPPFENESAAAHWLNERLRPFVAPARVAPAAAAPGGGGDDGGDPDTDFPERIGPLPLVPLGQRDGTYYLIARSHERRELGTRDLTTNGLLSLFDGDMTWLIARCPEGARRRGSSPGFDVRAAAAWIMRLCARRGLYDPSVPICGPGVWPAPVDKNTPAGDPALLIHVGDQLWLDGAWQNAGRVLGDAIYAAFPKIARPDLDPAPQTVAGLTTGAALGKQLRECIGLWSFKSDLLGGLLIGFIGLAFYGAAPSWRVHVLVTGERGTGKSKLVDLVVAALGGMVRHFNRYTEPGLRQILQSYARAVALDEAESSSLRVAPVIELLRNMAGEEGVKSVLGSSDQSGSTGNVTGAVILGAIHAPQLQPQDRSRIFPIELVKPGTDTATRVPEAIAWARRHSALLWARAIVGWPRFLQAFGTFKVALADKGCDQRQADLFAALLAGRDVLLHDVAIDADGAAEIIVRLKPLIDVIKLDDEIDSDPAQCLARLFSSQVEHWTGGRKATIGKLLQDAMGKEVAPAESAYQTLKSHGIRIEFTRPNIRESARKPFLLVAHRHDALTRIYVGTPWEGGGWRSALGRLAGATESKSPQWFTGIKVRATLIPQGHLPLAEDPEADESPP